jgi:ribosome modulation factor
MHELGEAPLSFLIDSYRVVSTLTHEAWCQAAHSSQHRPLSSSRTPLLHVRQNSALDGAESFLSLTLFERLFEFAVAIVPEEAEPRLDITVMPTRGDISGQENTVSQRDCTKSQEHRCPFGLIQGKNKHRCPFGLIQGKSLHRCPLGLIQGKNKHRCPLGLIQGKNKHRCPHGLIQGKSKHRCPHELIQSNMTSCTGAHTGFSRN